MSQNRLVDVRNDNEGIAYIGQWSTVEASTVNNLTNLINGPTFSPILHSTNTTSSFVFPFNGSSISVVGSINIANVSKVNQDPSWACAVDGIPLLLPNLISVNNQNIRILCSQGGITDGPHELVVNITSKGRPFYLDLLEYQPSPTLSLENTLIRINSNTDPAIDFVSGWEPIGILNGTTDPEGLVDVTFIGTQISWYGYTPFKQPPDASSGKFSIDGQPYTSFQIPGLEQFRATPFNRPIFTTPMLEMGTHVLSAKYTGGPGQTPFTFEYVVIQNGSFPSTTWPVSKNSSVGIGNPTSSTSTAPSESNDTRKNRNIQVGNIVGGVVGSIGVFVICSVILFFWFRIRNRKGANPRVLNPFSIQPGPTSNQTFRSQGILSNTQPFSQPAVFAHNVSVPPSNNPILPYQTNREISSGGSRRPLPAIPRSSILPCSLTDSDSIPVIRAASTRAPYQREHSGTYPRIHGVRLDTLA